MHSLACLEKGKKMGREQEEHLPKEVAGSCGEGVGQSIFCRGGSPGSGVPSPRASRVLETEGRWMGMNRSGFYNNGGFGPLCAWVWC